MKQEPKAIKYQSKTHRKLHTLINRVNEDTLMAAHKRQVADKATGIDGVTKEVYGSLCTTTHKQPCWQDETVQL